MQYDKHGVHFVLLRDLSSPCYEIVRKRPFDVSLCLLLRYYKADVIYVLGWKKSGRTTVRRSLEVASLAWQATGSTFWTLTQLPLYGSLRAT